MVSLEIEADDLVVLRFIAPYGPTDERDYLAALEDLARITRPFRLLAVFGGGPALSQAGDREQALWFKRTRAHLDAHCTICVLVRPGATAQSAAKFQKLWRFPVLAARREVAGRALLETRRQAQAALAEANEGI